MQLIELVNELITTTGRYDLQSPLGNTTRAINILNEAQRFLDLQIPVTDDMNARSVAPLQPGSQYAFFPDLRFPEDVRLLTTTQRQPLVKCEWDEIEHYFNLPVDQQERSMPIFWSRAVTTMSPAASSVDADGSNIYTNYFPTTINTNAGKSIVVYPVPDVLYNLEVIGCFFTPRFSNDVIETRWSAQYPELLIMAAMYKLEVRNRNSEGQRDLLNSIELELRSIAFDTISEIVYGDHSL